MTYDREVVKIFEDRIREANRKMIETNSVMTSVTGQRVKTDTGFDTLYNAQGMRISQPMAGTDTEKWVEATPSMADTPLAASAAVRQGNRAAL